MNNNLLLPTLITGLTIIAIATAPIWLPKIFGINAKECECGVQLTSSGFYPYCKCKYRGKII